MWCFPTSMSITKMGLKHVFYIGQTGRCFKQRYIEHTKAQTPPPNPPCKPHKMCIRDSRYTPQITPSHHRFFPTRYHYIFHFIVLQFTMKEFYTLFLASNGALVRCTPSTFNYNNLVQLRIHWSYNRYLGAELAYVLIKMFFCFQEHYSTLLCIYWVRCV